MFFKIFIVYLYDNNKQGAMKTKLPFNFNYTQEMSDKFNKELKESGVCGMKNPDFYDNWDLLEVGTPEYELALKQRRTKNEKTY